MTYYTLLTLEFLYRSPFKTVMLQPQQLPKAVGALDCLSLA